MGLTEKTNKLSSNHWNECELHIPTSGAKALNVSGNSGDPRPPVNCMM